MRQIMFITAAAAITLGAREFTRGPGVYPGDPKEYAGPALEVDASTYRNLALRRPAWHSSAYDYNLTAQLLTDGIRHTRLPRWVSTSTSRQGVLKKNEREWLLDGNWVSAVELKGTTGWVQVEIGGADVPEVHRVEIEARVFTRGQQPENWTCTLQGSADGSTWKDLGVISGMARPGGEVRAAFSLRDPVRWRFYRAVLEDPRATSFQVGEIAFFDSARRLPIGGPGDFTSAWMPAGKGEEWAYIDLGADCTFDRVAIHWIRRAAEGAVQVSSDASAWRTIVPLASSGDIKLDQPAQGRYVRLLLTKPATPDGYIVSEIEVWGRGGLVAKPKAAGTPAGARHDLAGGAWRIERDSVAQGAGPALSAPGFDDSRWLVATVPGTVLASFHNAGAIPDPNFGDNQLMISDSYFYADFWYRNEFAATPPPPGKRVWLNLDGVNWKAEVWLNGQKLGRVEGGFMRGRFDVTRLLYAGRKNALAIRVEKNATPGSVKEKTFESPDKNGGALGADNPTYHATIGWDWIPTMRGRDSGLRNDVYLTLTGGVTLEDPFVTTDLPLPDTSSADIGIEVTLRNHDATPVKGVLKGAYGGVTFEHLVTLEANASSAIKLSPATHPALRLRNPRLWWPNGYGDPNLYDVELRFEAARGEVSDRKALKSGVREFAYNEDGGIFRMWVNGRRFVPRGGNWGFPESMLRYRAREYDAAVRYHRHQNFTMIRNWVGQTGDDEFYEACDRHGIVVMQDFWLANPWDGPDPGDNEMFMRNVDDTVRRIRNHPSIGLYCGRNEGYPPAPLDRAIRKSLAALHPGVHYVSSSADDVISGHGPYRAMPLKHYFDQRAATKFHSEMGMPNIVTMDSLRLMMPASAMWPQGRMWGLHDFCLTGAQGGASFLERIKESYGGADNIEDWVALAQFINYEGYRAMFEAQGKNRMGLLIWMSHPAWPSLVWQTYDYYFDANAAYYAARKASEPLHIQWNPVTELVEVVNYSGGDARGLSAKASVYNLDGKPVWTRSATLDSQEDSVAAPVKMEYPPGVSAVHFIRLELSQSGRVVSENFYWRGTEHANYRALRALPKVAVIASTETARPGGAWSLTTTLRNNGNAPALMVRVKPVRARSGDRILPALSSDNYIALMPGEARTITTELRHADTRGEPPRIVVEGFNLIESAAR
jgi:beta-galactosidase/beta-glucuronidase